MRFAWVLVALALLVPSGARRKYKEKKSKCYGQYRCQKSTVPTSGRTCVCINKEHICDRTPNCPNGDDEVRCPCPKLQNPQNGYVNTTNGFDISKVASYACFPGFLLNGSSTRQCLNSSQWSGTAPACNRKACPKLTNPQNGQISSNGLEYTSTATYVCNSGYRLDGASTRTCLSTAMWSGFEPMCIKLVCPLLLNPSNGCVEMNGLQHNSKASYKCDYGFKLSSNPTRTCLECQSLSAPDDGFIDLSLSTRFLSVAIYSCKSGFFLMGDHKRTCMETCEWSGGEPFCKEIECGPLTAPANGEVEINMDGSLFWARYSCNVGFSLSGSSFVVCLEDGTWSSSMPDCVEIKCSTRLRIPYPGGSSVEILSEKVFGIAIYECKPGFKLVGNAQRVCLENGEWSGSTPICKR